jgi:hypothetical protein
VGSEVTGETGQVVGNLGQEADFVFGAISLPPFGDENFSPPFPQISACAPAEFSTGAIHPAPPYRSQRGEALWWGRIFQ